MIKKALIGFVNLLSIAIILCSVCVLLTVVLTKSGQAPDIFGYTFFRVMTGSMEPELPVDSLIVVKRVGGLELQPGDVISFYSRDPSLQGAVNTHRIVEMEKEADGSFTFVTKGDANNVEDRYPTFEKDLIGKVIYSSEGLGKFVRLLSNPIIFIPVVIVPLFVLLVSNLMQSIATAKKLVREEEEEAVRRAVEEIRQNKKSKE